MAIEVVKEADGSITIVKNAAKECSCTIEKVLAQKTKVEGILSEFDVKVYNERTRILTDFDNNMAKLKSDYQAKLVEINDVLQKAVAAGCVLPE